MFKARLVVKGFAQKAGIDFSEIFSFIVRYIKIKITLSLVAYFDWDLEQMDVKITFLHGFLDREIYMDQPKGF